MTYVEKLIRLRNSRALVWTNNEYETGFFEAITQAIEVYKEHSDWIPAASPPLKEGEYNVTSKSFKETKTMYYSLLRNEWYDFENGIYDDDDILAWQPLPEPYKGE